MIPLVLVHLHAPADQTRGPQYLEAALDAWLQTANPRRTPIALAMTWDADQVRLSLDGPTESLRPLIEQLADAYPDCRFTRVAEEIEQYPSSWSARLRLTPDIFPLRTFPQFEDRLNRNLADPLAGLLSALRAVGTVGGRPQMRIGIRPATRRRVARNQRAIRRLGAVFRPSGYRTTTPCLPPRIGRFCALRDVACRGCRRAALDRPAWTRRFADWKPTSSRPRSTSA